MSADISIKNIMANIGHPGKSKFPKNIMEIRYRSTHENIFRLNTITYGIISVSFLATVRLNKLAEKYDISRGILGNKVVISI